MYRRYSNWGAMDHLLTSVSNNCTCDIHPAVTEFFDTKICNLPIVGAWLLAVLVGLSAGTLLRRLGPFVTGSFSYSITFFTYAVMITSGVIVHSFFLVECGQEQPNNFFRIIGIVDASLTSCIALSFFFNGLIDLNIMAEREFSSFAVMLFTYMWIFFAYFTKLVCPMKLYFTSVLVGCGSYVLCQLLRMAMKRSLNGAGYLLVGGAVGGASYAGVRVFWCWFCNILGPWSIQGLWYYGSDVAMFFIFLYVWSTRSRPNKNTSCGVSPTKTKPPPEKITV